MAKRGGFPGGMGMHGMGMTGNMGNLMKQAQKIMCVHAFVNIHKRDR